MKTSQSHVTKPPPKNSDLSLSPGSPHGGHRGPHAPTLRQVDQVGVGPDHALAVHAAHDERVAGVDPGRAVLAGGVGHGRAGAGEAGGVVEDGGGERGGVLVAAGQPPPAVV